MKFSLGLNVMVLFFFTVQFCTADIPEYEMETITVTTNRTVSSGDNTGTFEVITREEIEKGDYMNVSQVLKSVPGVYFAEESVMGNRSTESNTGPKIRIRGKGAKLLIDGRPMNMTIYGCLINNMLTLDHVERIEVTRGSESVLYGSDGLGGVINIITREPSELNSGLSLRAGSHNTVYSTAEHSNKIGPIGYFFSGSLKRSNGQRKQSDFADQSGFFKLHYEITPSMKIESSFNIYKLKMDDPGPVIAPLTDFWSEIGRRQADITIKGQAESITYSVKAYHNEGHHIFEEQDGWHSRDYTNGLRTDMVRNFAGGMNRLIFGFDGRLIGGKALIDENKYQNGGFKFWLNNREWFDKNEMAVFASDRQILMDGRLSLIGGLRVVNDSEYGAYFCPKAGAVLSGEKYRIRLGYNRAYRSPSLLQTHLHTKSNPTLNPEVADHFEVGGDYYLMEKLTLGASLFYTDGRDQVEMVMQEMPWGTVPVQFENVKTWKHRGAEFTARWSLSKRLSLDTGYTYIDVGSNTQYNPEHQANFTITTSRAVLKRDLTFSIHGIGISRLYASDNHKYRLPDYVNIDFFADWHIHKYFTILMGVNNILDREYETVRGYPFPGLLFTAGIRLEQ